MTSNLLPFAEDWIEQWLSQPPERRRERNRARVDEHGQSFSDLLERPARLNDQAVGSIVYCHVPKTGGTSLEQALARNYRPHDVLHINGPVWQRNPYTLFKRGIDQPSQIVMGHYHLGDPLYQWLPTPITHVTLLRDPVERVVSYYHYVRRRRPHPLHAMAHSADIAEFLQRPEVVEARNGQVRRLSGIVNEGGARNLTPADVDFAMKSLERDFSFVGVTEQFDAFLATGERLLAWPEPFAKPANRADRPNPVSDRDREAIAAENLEDQRLFERAKKLVAKQNAALGLNDDELTAFRRRAARWSQSLS